MATLEIGTSLGLMLLPPGPFKVVLLKVELTPETAVAFVVTQTLPPTGVEREFGPGPSVVA
jgi:hypothetical protein